MNQPKHPLSFDYDDEACRRWTYCFGEVAEGCRAERRERGTEAGLALVDSLHEQLIRAVLEPDADEGQ